MLLRRTVLALVILCSSVLIPADGYLGAAQADFAIIRAVGAREFRLGAWEVQAIAQKLRDQVVQPGAGLDPAEEQSVVLQYLATVAQIGRLEAEIERIYSGSVENGTLGAAESLQAQIDGLRAGQERVRPMVERILEQQVAGALELAGLSTLGHVWPPIRFQFTESPNYLIVSPRDRIAIQHGVYLDPAIAVEEMEWIEGEVEQALNVSALIEGTGGFSSYPTMVLEYSVLEWIVDTIAHEWAHTYLVFHPLGWHYYDSGSMRTMNETVASMVGSEISQIVLQRYYPDQLGATPWPRPFSLRSGGSDGSADGSRFEFGPFMRETRLTVDRLLADGRIDEAERYMEERRAILTDNGYSIRRLNQAYFAFHGSYAVGPAATDPIGGKLRALRQRLRSLQEFVRTAQQFDDPLDLDRALSQA